MSANQSSTAGPLGTEGGFLRAGLLSPPASTATAPSTAATLLPTPRSKPLKLGSSKEGAFIDYVDTHITLITRRFANKKTRLESRYASASTMEDVDPQADDGTVQGYESFVRAGKDIDKLLDMVWVSGTPSLQVSYFLSLAVLVVSYIAAFPPAPKTTFRVLDKLDLAFSQLITGRDIDSGSSLPGFEGRNPITMTQKVRIRSLAERTRIVVADVIGQDPSQYENEEESQVDSSSNGDVTDAEIDETEEFEWQMEAGQVYVRTLQELGDSIDPRESEE